ncbi:uncharacterized protein BO80DRAFT_66123 [Aspergillus ibericus CBS 121593]|uniref:Uncharacterized protein n=1 Tax=Aspergillus ibericus CBS 121593 TaxID=1448316 RepID=A0A395H2B3_9EURO|nr:hypothetical protein BO80DRAFT_66123 [Aspergillus ibericus CBS 121593]RAL01345.1 hypothetical protein BO80DRAFT_66123 [Aspergillus ibericus CBS 121593]
MRELTVASEQRSTTTQKPKGQRERAAARSGLAGARGQSLNAFHNSAQVNSSRRPSPPPPPPPIHSFSLHSTFARPTHAGASLIFYSFTPSLPLLFSLFVIPPSLSFHLTPLPPPPVVIPGARRRPECLRPRNVRWRFLTAAAHSPEHEARLDTVALDAKPRATALSCSYCDNSPRQASPFRGASSLRRSGRF